MPSARAAVLQVCTRFAENTAAGADDGFPACRAPATTGQSGHQITMVRARSVLVVRAGLGALVLSTLALASMRPLCPV